MQSDDERFVEQVNRFAMDLERQGRSMSDAQQSLMELGLPPDIAKLVVDNVARRGIARRQTAIRNLKHGAIAATIGGILTLATYSAADPGGTYIVFYGALLLGGFWILMGIVRYMTSGNNWGHFVEPIAAVHTAQHHKRPDPHDWSGYR